MRLIDADALIEEFERYMWDQKELHDAVATINEAPTVIGNEAPTVIGAVGWICPVCGRGLSPYTAVCPCRNGKGWEITCG